MLQSLRLHGLGQLAMVWPEFQRPPVEHKKAIVTFGDRLQLN